MKDLRTRAQSVGEMCLDLEMSIVMLREPRFDAREGTTQRRLAGRLVDEIGGGRITRHALQCCGWRPISDQFAACSETRLPSTSNSRRRMKSAK